MKIAVITDDEHTISQHFGRAPYYRVATVADGQVIEWQRRDKLGHAHFAASRISTSPANNTALILYRKIGTRAWRKPLPIVRC